MYWHKLRLNFKIRSWKLEGVARYELRVVNGTSLLCDKRINDSVQNSASNFQFLTSDFFHLNYCMETIEIIGAIIGLLYLYLEYKADKWLWPVGVLMPLIYVYIFFHAKYYAYMGINIYYFFASIYGWIKWTRTPANSPEIRISHTPKKYFLPLAIIFAATFALIAYILVHYTDSPIAYGESFTTALSIIAMWMLAQKYIEQWGLWIVVNAVTIWLFFWEGEIKYTAALYIIYTIVPFFGYMEWKKQMFAVEK